jgi:hypothetical protein
MTTRKGATEVTSGGSRGSVQAPGSKWKRFYSKAVWEVAVRPIATASVWKQVRLPPPCGFYRVLTMVYNTQNYWLFGLFPSSSILENRKHDASETASVSVP